MMPIKSIGEIEDKIVKINAFCLSSNYGDNKSFGQPLGVKTVGFIEITSTSGLIGYGESYAAIYIPELMSEICKSLEKYFIGKNISDLSLSDCITEIPFIGRNGLLQSISSAIDSAIWDLRGKLLKLPVYKLFEKSIPTKDVYLSGGSVILTPEEIDIEVNNILNEKKFSLYKMRIGYQAWEDDLKRITAAHNLFKDSNLMVDAIMGTLRPTWSHFEAKNKIDQLEHFNLKWIEEPLFPNDIQGLKKLRNSVKTPIAAGEAYSGSTEIEQLINSDALKFIQIDATHTGSFKLCYELSKQASLRKIESVTHVWGTNLALLANAHMACANSNITLVEVPSINLELNEFLYPDGVIINDGKINLTDAPGYGIEIDEKIKNKFSFVLNSGYSLPNKRD